MKLMRRRCSACKALFLCLTRGGFQQKGVQSGDCKHPYHNEYFCSEECQESAGQATEMAFGIGKAPVLRDVMVDVCGGRSGARGGRSGSR